MSSPLYRIESQYPIMGPLLAGVSLNPIDIADRGAAIAIAAKSQTKPPGMEIRVIHQPSGEVVYCKAEARYFPATPMTRRSGDLKMKESACK